MVEKMRKANDKGFALVELLVAMGIAGLVMAGIYTAFYSQQKSYAVQEEVAAMQQNLRTGLYHVEREIRMAGYDPTFSGLFGLKADGSDGRVTDANNIYFTMDANENGLEDNSDEEQIAFRLEGGDLQKYSPGSSPPWLPVAENIASLGFVYKDRDGNPTTTLSDVRSIAVTLGTETSTKASEYLRQRTLTTEVKCRNFGL